MWSQRIAVAAMLSLVAGPSVASLIQASEVLSFELPTIEYTQYSPLTPQNMAEAHHTQGLTLHFAAFDTSLGTLKSAYLSYQDTYAIEYSVTAGTRLDYWYEMPIHSGHVAGLAYYKYAFGLTATGVSGPIEKTLHGDEMTTQVSDHRHSGLSYMNFDGSGPKDPYGDNTIDGKYLWQPWVSGGDLSVPLLGLADGLDVFGASVDVTLRKDITAYMAPFFSAFVDPDYSFVHNYLNDWSGRLALTYIYETNGPSPIPEPGTLLLAGTALLALAWAQRRPVG